MLLNNHQYENMWTHEMKRKEMKTHDKAVFCYRSTFLKVIDHYIRRNTGKASYVLKMVFRASKYQI